MIFANDTARKVSGTPVRDAGALRAAVLRRHSTPGLAPVSGAQERAMFYARGSTLHSTMEYLGHALSAAELEDVLSRLTAEERRLVETAGVTDDVPYHAALSLWRSADRELAARDPRWAERAGAEAIRVRGMQLYAGLIQKPSPDDFLTQHISLFQRYYRPGDIVVTDRVAGRATVRLVGFEAGDRLFCSRLTGGWLAGIELAGGRDAQVTHARCVLEGDLFCEWEVRWR